MSRMGKEKCFNQLLMLLLGMNLLWANTTAYAQKYKDLFNDMNLDSTKIPRSDGDTMKYSRDEFNKLKSEHPELFSDSYYPPDETYFCYGINGFGSYAGQDDYYSIYAFLLKHVNGEKRYAVQRKKLIEIYGAINSLFGHLLGGGTYFGHQFLRIPAFVEYSIYRYLNGKDDSLKSYDITKQKNLYISSLRQLVNDETRILGESNEDYKTEDSEINASLRKIEELITCKLYLRLAQEFQYRHYGSL